MQNVPAAFPASRPPVFVRALASLAILLALASTSTGAQQTSNRKVPLTISGSIGLWLPQFDGVMRSGTAAAPGSPIRFDTHLDLEEHPEVYDFGLALGDIRYGKISASFLRFNAPGNKVLTHDHTFSGVTFYRPETVRSEVSVALDRVTVSYLQDMRGAYILTYEVGMAFLRWDGSIRNRITGKSASEDASANLPLTGLHAIFPLGDYFRIKVGFLGVFFSTSSDDISIVETYGEFVFSLAEYLFIGLGYKHFRLDGELELNGDKVGELEYTLNGIYFTIGIKI